MMIASLWSNSNWDDDKGSRQDAITSLEEKYEQAIEIIRTGVVDEGEEIDKDDPFFAAAERGIEKIQSRANANGTVGDAISYEDQAKNENEFKKYIDQ